MPAAGGLLVCLQGVGLQELVQQLLPMLPALQTHLSTALSVIRQPPEPGREVLLEGAELAGISAYAVLYSLLLQPSFCKQQAAGSTNTSTLL
jgi:hypothetical protein